MRRKRLLSLFVLIIVVLLSATTIWAGTYRSPDKDTACDVGGTCWNDSGIYLSTSGQTSGGCKTTPDWVGYMDWDLTSENRTWHSASLKLTDYKHSGGTQPYTFKLFAVNNTSWTETNSQTDPGYDPNTVLGTAIVDLDATSVVEFKDDSNNTLGTYFAGKKGDHASIAVAITGGCPATGSVIVQFEDREGHGGSAPTSANEPDLIFWTEDGATAISLSSVNANTSSPNWPVIAGLFALAAVVVVGVGYGVRRSKQS